MKTVSNNTWQKIADADYIAGLKRGDGMITEAFFYGLCNYTLNDIRVSLMHKAVDYDELVNELFIYLSKDGWHKLDTFAGLNGCTLRSWMVRLTWRYFMSQRERLLGIVSLNTDDVQIGDTVDNLSVEIQMDVEATLVRMPNKRYVQVLEWMLMDGLDADEVAARLNTCPANVYNIKHRAIVQFVEFFNAC